MGSFAGGKWSLWGMGPFDSQHSSNSRRRRRRSNGESKPSNSVEATGGGGFQFPVKQALTAASLTFTGDAIAQFRQRWVKNFGERSDPYDTKVCYFAVFFFFFFFFLRSVGWKTF